jgi:hypothetical protein
MAGFVTIAAVVAVSGISGAVVTLELIAPKPPRGDTAPDLAVKPSETTGTSDRTASITLPSAPATVQPVAQNGKRDGTSDGLTARATLAPPAAYAQAQPAIAAAPQANAPAVAGKSARGVTETDLTFAKGYAQRHAAQERGTQERASQETASAATPTVDGKVAAVSQLGRAAVPHKPAYARYAGSPDARRQAWRGEATGYYNPYEYRRHEALAYGDEPPRRRADPGFFGGLFRNN